MCNFNFVSAVFLTKRRVIWGIGLTLLLIFVSLFGLQFLYYNRIVSIRKEQIKQITKNALADVAKDIELRELVRYINHELKTSHIGDNTLVSTLRQIVGDDVAASTYGIDSLIAPFLSAEQVKAQYLSLDTMALSDKILRAFFVNRAALDEYVLRNIYRVFHTDSIPQLINPRYLQNQLHYRLEQKGVTEDYIFAVCDASGRVLYEYVRPGLLRVKYDEAHVVTHRLFANADKPDKPTPFLRLVLDFKTDSSEMFSLLLPGAIVSIFTLLFGILSVIVLIKQSNFEEVKTGFMNNMTHELKTPVSSIILAEQMLRSGRTIEDKEKRTRLLSVIDQEAQRLKLLIEKVLQVSLFDGRMKDIPLSVMDVNEILLQAAEIYSVHAEQRKGSLKLEFHAENTWVCANTTHMTNILYNLLDNAVKYSDPNRPLELIISTSNIDDQIIISIEDNGIGIPKESLTKIFERYYRVPFGLRHDVKGFGLGLAYVYSVVRQFKGKITAENRASGGTRMVIRLPLHRDAE